MEFKIFNNDNLNCDLQDKHFLSVVSYVYGVVDSSLKVLEIDSNVALSIVAKFVDSQKNVEYQSFCRGDLSEVFLNVYDNLVDIYVAARDIADMGDNPPANWPIPEVIQEENLKKTLEIASQRLGDILSDEQK